jgi:cytochrome c5
MHHRLMEAVQINLFQTKDHSMKNHLIKVILVLFGFALITASCSKREPSNTADKTTVPEKKEVVETDPMKNIGIGPIKSVSLNAEIDEEMAAEGKDVYEKMCTACHRSDKKFIGPSPQGVLERRSPEWVMNMILNPEEMVEKDPVARALLIEYNGSPMANQNLTEEQARAVLEYFRTL